VVVRTRKRRPESLDREATIDRIIGRREELQALARFVDAVPTGGYALLLEGEAGIGKTALWQEGTAAARQSDVCVLAARAGQAETGIAFATVGDLFAPTLDETLPRLPPVQRRALEIALLLREPEGAPPEVRVLGLALVSALRALTWERPVLLALDDVQWVDPSSSAILAFMLNRLEGEPVGVLATVRGHPARAPLGLDRAFAAFERLPVGPLSVGAIHRMLWGRLSLNLPRPVLVRVHETCGGNPFYALQLGRALADGTILPGSGPMSLPESLQSVVAARLDTLPRRVRETLVAVAALSAPTVTLLEALAPEAVDDLDRARGRGVLELDGDRIRFTHPLFAPACYSTMPLHRRRRLHARLARLDVDVEERARHLAVAATGPDETVAHALDTATARARARGAALAAAELSELAVALTPTHAVDDANRRRITAAEHWMDAGDRARARRLLEAVVSSPSPSPVRAAALGRLALVRQETKGFREAERLLNRALDEPALDPQERIDILCRLAWMTAAGRGSVEGIRYAEEALRLAERLAEPAQLAASLATLAELTFWRTGRIRRDLLDRAIELGRTVDRFHDGRVTLARVLGRADRYEEARALWTELIAEGRARSDPSVTAWMMFLALAQMEVASGRWDTARRVCEEAIELARQTGHEQEEGSICRMVLAEIDAYRGEAEKTRREIPELVRVAVGAGYFGAILRLTRALAELELSCGDAGASWRLTAPLLADVTELDEALAQLAGSVGIEALVEIGDLAGAERLWTLLDAQAAESDTAVRWLAYRCRGLILAAHGEHERAIETLETVASDPDAPQGTNPFERARTLLALGSVQRRANHKRAARETLELAAESFGRLGARRWEAKARAELRRIGGRTASESELYETERRIVELVVAGRRNREVAVELSLSPNTVAWNLSKIYRKLGVRSRTELAARIAASTPK
jgi:DNA-binding NarL/FixJ family response regulator/tetratricopeptide (TPR) repeat protein